MIAKTQEKNDRSISPTSFLNPYIERFERDIKLNQQRLEEISSVKFYTSQDKEDKKNAEAEIAYKSNLIAQIRLMQKLPPGSWVKNGSNKPGKVIELRVIGSVPEVQVQWWGATVPVPEQAANLKLIDAYQMEYIWNGDRIPKLIRRIDRHECDEIDVLNNLLSDEKDKTKQIYLKKRIAWINQQDLERLERVVRQGLEIFYRVGEAIAEIRDRKLYKDLGYKTFQDYCIEKWNMKRRYADRLINSSTVVNNLIESENESHGTQKNNELKNESHGTQNLSPEKSVPHGGQNEPIAFGNPTLQSNGESATPIAYQSRGASPGGLRRSERTSASSSLRRGQSVEEPSEIVIPQSERVTREIGKAPTQKQSEVWQKTVDRYGDSPTAKQVKEVVAEIVNCPDKDSTLEISCPERTTRGDDKGLVRMFSSSPASSTNKRLVENFEVGQVVVIDPPSNRPDKRLVGFKSSKAVVTKINFSTVNLKVWGNILNAVAVQDIKLLDEFESVTFCYSVNQKATAFLMQEFDSPSQLIQFVLKEKGFYS